EIMLGSVLQHGMEITSRAEEADVLVVNTCAFIDSAKEESIEAILQAHLQRGLTKRPDQKLIVSGCMSQRFAKELWLEMPEVDAFIGLDQVAHLGEIVEKIFDCRDSERSEAKSRNPVAKPCGNNTGSLDFARDDEMDAFTYRRPTYIPDYDTPRF